MSTGVLLVNLGTPDSYEPADVKRYLLEFLLDPRVVDLPPVKRNLIVRGLIVPKRYKASAANYRRIWTPAGSPLLVHTAHLKEKLQTTLGEGFVVEMAMRYRHPSIAEGLAKLKAARVERLVVLPLFPQYASATTGSVLQKVMEEIKGWVNIPRLALVNQFADHPAFIEAWRQIGEAHQPDQYDHVVISFHGLPEGQVRKADPSGTCLSRPDCCSVPTPDNQSCYRAQCERTARGIVSALQLDSSRLTICFQSRVGQMAWLRPYATDVFRELGEKRMGRVLVFCPSFVCDCLETTDEIAIEGQKTFREAGGGELHLVHGLNTHPAWLRALREIVLEHGGHKASQESGRLVSCVF